MTTVSQEAVEVTQADIEAVRRFYNSSSANLTGQELVELEQAFARHRQSANRDVKNWARIANTAVTRGLSLERELAEARQSAERGEVVAWMYERKGPWPARYFHDKRTPAYLDEGEGWTETPLYTLPTPPEAGA